MVDCPLCEDPSKGMALIAELSITRAYLQPSASFRGYCILVLKRHAVEIDDLSLQERSSLMEDVARVAHAIRAVCRPAKLNYEILGNVVPHIHVHIIPRYTADPTWDRAAWFAFPDEKPLPENEYSALAKAIRRATKPANIPSP